MDTGQSVVLAEWEDVPYTRIIANVTTVELTQKNVLMNRGYSRICLSDLDRIRKNNVVFRKYHSYFFCNRGLEAMLITTWHEIGNETNEIHTVSIDKVVDNYLHLMRVVYLIDDNLTIKNIVS